MDKTKKVESLKKKKALEKKTTSNETEKIVQENPSKQTEKILRETCTAYEGAIKNYEAYYQRQRANIYKSWRHHQHPYFSDFFSSYNPSAYRSYSNIPTGTEYDEALNQFDQGLQIVEQSLADYKAVQEYLAGLEKNDRQNYLLGWKEYLEQMLDYSKQMTKSIEDYTRYLT